MVVVGVKGYLGFNFRKLLDLFLISPAFPVRFLSYETMARPGGLEHDQLFSNVTELVREYLIKYQERSSKVGLKYVAIN